MTVKAGINGFGRIGRLAFRAAWDSSDIEVLHINEIAGDAATAAHLLKYDTVHGTWAVDVEAGEDCLIVGGRRVGYGSHPELAATPWGKLGVDVVLECTGKFKSAAALQPYFDAGVKKVAVSAPLKDGSLNVVLGVNDHLLDGSQQIVSAASCTTNCLAPVVDVLQKQFGIKHGSLTTIHAVTISQHCVDDFSKDLRRARACGESLIPTTTGSASAIAEIFPELKGRLNGLAVRVPVVNASLTDCVFELEKTVTEAQVNQALEDASKGYLQGILGFETKPLVSADYANDKRSSIVDGLSTMVINGTHVKILTWYDNETGYSNRLVELAIRLGS